MQLLVDLYRRAKRQGPGGEAETERALALAGLDRGAPLRIADLGCGTGASTLALARLLDAQITAVDFLQGFLDELEDRARQQGLSHKIDRLCRSMDDLPFADQTFDAVWSEGAIYNMGFARGVQAWRRLLKPGGVLVVSEITWLSSTRPARLQAFWEGEYPEIHLASAKMGVLEQHGYVPTGYFVLPESCWRDNYYRPMQDGFDAFLKRNGNSAAARALVDAELEEIALYEEYRSFYSYGVYVARRLG